MGTVIFRSGARWNRNGRLEAGWSSYDEGSNASTSARRMWRARRPRRLPARRCRWHTLQAVASPCLAFHHPHWHSIDTCLVSAILTDVVGLPGILGTVSSLCSNLQVVTCGSAVQLVQLALVHTTRMEAVRARS